MDAILMFKQLSSVFFALLLFSQAIASSQGPNLPGTAASTGSGPTAWVNINNIKADDGVNTTFALAAVGVTPTAKVTNFGFSLGGGVTSIDGILVELEGKVVTGSGTLKDSSLKLTKDNTTTTGDDKADTSTAWTSSYNTVSYGGASDTWSITPTQSDVEASTFGVWFIGQMTSGTFTTMGVDFIRVTIYYTAGGAAAVQSRTLLGVGQ